MFVVIVNSKWFVHGLFEIIQNYVNKSIDYAYTHTQMRIHLYIYMHKVLPTVYYSCHLVISNYHQSFQHSFQILLNCKKVEIYCHEKKEN